MIIRNFRAGDRVDVHLYDAQVSLAGEHAVTFFVDGHDEPITIPTCDDDGHPLPFVDVLDAIRVGHVYRSVRTGELLLATLADGHVQLVGPDNSALRPHAATEVWGQLERVGGPSLPEAPDPDTGIAEPIADPAQRIDEVAAIAPEYVRHVPVIPGTRPADLGDTLTLPAVPADAIGPPR